MPLQNPVPRCEKSGCKSAGPHFRSDVVIARSVHAPRNIGGKVALSGVVQQVAQLMGEAGAERPGMLERTAVGVNQHDRRGGWFPYAGGIDVFGTEGDPCHMNTRIIEQSGSSLVKSLRGPLQGPAPPSRLLRVCILRAKARLSGRQWCAYVAAAGFPSATAP